MPRPPKKPVSITDLPVLTEAPDADTNLPVLTDTLAEGAPAPKRQPRAVQLTDAQCRQVADYIAPQLEQLLQEKIAARMTALWPEIWKEIQADLPGMIREVIIESGRRTRK